MVFSFQGLRLSRDKAKEENEPGHEEPSGDGAGGSVEGGADGVSGAGHVWMGLAWRIAGMVGVSFRCQIQESARVTAREPFARISVFAFDPPRAVLMAVRQGLFGVVEAGGNLPLSVIPTCFHCVSVLVCSRSGC